MRIHHVQVSCPAGGEDAARRFYADLLGLPEVEKPPVLAARGGCWFRDEGVEVHVGVEEGFTPARKAHPAFLVEAIDALAARAADAGFPVTWGRRLPRLPAFPHRRRQRQPGRDPPGFLDDPRHRPVRWLRWRRYGVLGRGRPP